MNSSQKSEILPVRFGNVSNTKRYVVEVPSRNMTPKDWIVVAVMAMMCTMPLTSLDYEFLEDNWIIAQGPGGQGNQNSSLIIPANQTLAFDSAFSFGSSRGYEGVSDIISHNGFTYVSGAYSGDINLGIGCSASSDHLDPEYNVDLDYGMPFVAKFDNNGTCIWISPVTYTGQGVSGSSDPITNTEDSHEIAMDSNGNLYFISRISTTFSNTLNFGNLTQQTSGYHGVYLAKINPNGSWEWVEKIGTNYVCPCTVNVDSSDNIWATARDVNTNPYFQVLKKYDDNGQLLNSSQINQGNVEIHATTSDANNNLYFAGEFDGTFSVSINGTSQSISYESPGEDLLIGKMDAHGNFLWLQKAAQSSQISKIYDIAINGTDEIYLTGYFYAKLELANTTLNAGGSSNGFLAKINSTGDWQWLKEMDCSCTVEMRSIAADVSGNLYVSGYQTNGLVTYGNGISNTGSSGAKDAIVAKYDPNGNAQWAKSFGSNNDDQARAITLDRQGNLFVTGIFGETVNIGAFQLTTSGYADIFISRLSVDYDDDQIPDVNDVDDDGDFIHDPLDSCHFSPIGFRSTGSSDHDSDGCDDSSEDFDDDNDQLNDTLDSCPKGMTGWIRTNASDFDSDGCMDALEDYDDDNDGVDDYEDYCSRIPGNSTFELEKGCPDADGDGRPDILDPFKNDSTEWSDMDGDEVGDNSDAFPLDATQQSDTDGDTYGDEEFGNAGDSCPEVFGNSTIDRYGCLDTDGDGWSDAGDDFPNDPNEYLDTDSDLVPDHLDEFPFDPTQQTDSDGDGYGDNPNGNLGDVFPNDATRYADSDRDGVDDASDTFPYDPTQTEDKDGDGMGDNPMGIGADKFPDDVSQWGDIDGDGFGDNPNGTNPDAFITDATQWIDEDGDGYGDNPAGRLYDLFPQNPTQWLDEDGDGLGDNLTGTNADPYLFDFDNDGYNDSIDPLPKRASPGDLDNDGVLDVNDLFREDIREWADYDGDGEGDNADSDDDNDGWADTDEIRLGTDPFSSADVPVDSFEIVIPGTAVGLGAWDLIGMFGGIPLFVWIGFGFVTRNSRSAKYEGLLREAQTRDELEDVARMWEYSLMLRMLGPHQGIRLERLRAELDDVFEGQNQKLSSLGPQEHNHTQIVEQAMQIDHKPLPSIESALPNINAQGNPDGKGYEWHSDAQGTSWYRNEGSNSEWQIFDK